MPELAFDFSRVTAKAMAGFFAAVRENDVARIAEVLACVVTACPWGPPDDPETYLALPFYGAFMDVVTAMTTAAGNARKR